MACVCPSLEGRIRGGGDLCENRFSRLYVTDSVIIFEKTKAKSCQIVKLKERLKL